MVFEKKQSRLRHFIWWHHDLERLVMQNCQVRLSEFIPSLRDLEIRKIKLAGGAAGSINNENITEDLAALPVLEYIDVMSDDEGLSKILTNPHCELCGLEFKTGNPTPRNSAGKKRAPFLARDKKSQHLISHFREDILKDLPDKRKCPKCTYIGKSLTELTTHYGLNHKILVTGKKHAFKN